MDCLTMAFSWTLRAIMRKVLESVTTGMVFVSRHESGKNPTAVRGGRKHEPPWV